MIIKGILEEILDSPPPEDVSDVLLEASIISVIKNPTEEERVIERSFISFFLSRGLLFPF